MPGVGRPTLGAWFFLYPQQSRASCVHFQSQFSHLWSKDNNHRARERFECHMSVRILLQILSVGRVGRPWSIQRWHACLCSLPHPLGSTPPSEPPIFYSLDAPPPSPALLSQAFTDIVSVQVYSIPSQELIRHATTVLTSSPTFPASGSLCLVRLPRHRTFYLSVLPRAALIYIITGNMDLCNWSIRIVLRIYIHPLSFLLVQRAMSTTRASVTVFSHLLLLQTRALWIQSTVDQNYPGEKM